MIMALTCINVGSGGSVLVQDIPDTMSHDIPDGMSQVIGDSPVVSVPAMSKARLVITAVVRREATRRRGRRPLRGVPLLGLRAHGPLPRPRARPRSNRGPDARTTSPGATAPETVELILRAAQAARPRPASTPARHHRLAPGTTTTTSTVSRATINRILTRAGAVTPEPKKRPKSSYIRFEAAMPNETWQSDFTHYRLTRPDGRPGADVEIITWLDDCTRYALHVTAHRRVTAPIVLDHLPRNRSPARHPRLHPDRQRHGLHRPPGRPDATAAATPSSNELRDLARRSRRTPDPTTPPPAARSNASSRP